MILSSQTSLKFSNINKLQKLKEVAEEYNRVVNFIISSFWGKAFSSFLPKDFIIASWISARLKQAAYKQAIQNLKSVKERQKKGKKVSKPEVKNLVMELDERFVDIKEGKTYFDGFIKLSSLGNKIKLNLPFKKHRHINMLEEEGFKRKKSVRISFNHTQAFVTFYYEKEVIPNPSTKAIGCDTGIKKLLVTSDGDYLGEAIEPLINKIKRKKQNSKAYKRALKERDEYINKVVKKLPNAHIVVENLTGIGQKTKKRLKKEFRKTISHWTYRNVVSRIENLCDRKGFSVYKIDPAYTSQTCNKCKAVHRENRNGEIFKCIQCGYTDDADHNASLNILDRYLSSQHMVERRTKTKSNKS